MSILKGFCTFVYQQIIIEMNIYLVGMMGAGKSTFGRQLAKHLQYNFIDLDDAIVKETGKSIETIFQESGETSFREIEKEVLHKTSQNNQNKVIATGGGAPCFYDNMEYMNENGITIFLNISADEIAERLSKSDNNHRPIIKNKNKEELEIRIPFYEKSKIEILNPDINLDYLKGMFQ